MSDSKAHWIVQVMTQLFAEGKGSDRIDPENLAFMCTHLAALQPIEALPLPSVAVDDFGAIYLEWPGNPLVCMTFADQSVDVYVDHDDLETEWSTLHHANVLARALLAIASAARGDGA